MESAKSIIESIERKHAPSNRVEIKNLANTSFKSYPQSQVILGVTQSDPMQNNINHYRSRIENEILRVSPGVGIDCLAWSFNGDEKDEAEAVLRDLADHFQIANIDAQKLIHDVLKHSKGPYCFIVVTVVVYNIVVPA